MADKLTEETFCSNKISYLQWFKGLPSLVPKLISYALPAYPLALIDSLIDLDKQLKHNLLRTYVCLRYASKDFYSMIPTGYVGKHYNLLAT